MLIVCKICGEESPSNKHFWETHKIKESTYFIQYYNKKDLYSGEPLPFKNRENYLLYDFVNRRNLLNYLKSLSLSDARTYCCNFLQNLKQIKNLTYTPSQVELRSLIAPGINYLNKLFGNYYELCKIIGYQNRFIHYQASNLEAIDATRLSGVQIIVDTREQQMLKINHPIQVNKLNYGDYCLSDPSLNECVFIERKSLTDLISTVSGGLERFEKEIARAQNEKAYLIVLVEEGLERCLAFNCLPWVSKKIRATPEFIWHRVRYLLQKYPNIQFVFCDGRKEAALMLTKILFSKNIQNFDIQLLIDTEQF